MNNLNQIRQYIEKARQDVLNKRPDDDTGALLFMGETQDPIPRTLIIDSSLNAIDVRVWMLLRIGIANPVLPGKLPTHKQLANTIQCSETTIWSSMQVLRLNRWLTLCERVRDQKQMNRGNIYAIHTEPMTIADTLQLDPQYLDFVKQSLNSKTRHIKNNAMAAHITFYEQINNEEDTFKRSQIEQHNARLEALQRTKNEPDNWNNDYQYYAQNFSQIESQAYFNEKENENCENFAPSDEKSDLISTGPSFWGRENLPAPEFDAGKKSTGPKNWGRTEMAQPCDLSPTPEFGAGKSSSCSSNNNKRLSNTTTTTTDQAFSEKNLKDLEKLKKFILPYEYPIAQSVLMSIPGQVRQDVLDQLLGRLQSYQKTGQGQIYNLLGFMNKLRSAVFSGEFTVDSYGLSVKNARSVREKNARQAAAATAGRADKNSADKKTSNPQVRKKGIEALAELKAKMKVGL